MTFTYSTHDEATPEGAVVDAGLDDWNAHAAPLDAVQPITCIARTQSGEVVGGAVGRTWGTCAELQQVWVAPPHRRRGVGSRLVRLYEARASERGCRTFYLTTFSFQAPSLYRSLGYEVALELLGFPDGIVKYLMVRSVDVAR